MPKILNTNMGLGFQRGRKYDMDLGRLGRMETAQSELRKTRELNLQTEMKNLKNSMKTYSTPRFSAYPYKVMMTESDLRMFSEVLQREFGMGDVVGGVVNGVRDVTGNIVEGAGKVVGSGVGKLAGVGAGMLGGAKLGGAFLGPLGAAGGAILGALAGPKIMDTAGSTLRNLGRDIHS